MRERWARVRVVALVGGSMVLAAVMLLWPDLLRLLAAQRATPIQAEAPLERLRAVPDGDRQPQRTPTGRPESTSAAGDLFEVAWVGDTLVGDLAQPHVDRRGYEWPFERVRALMEADYLVGNHEGPITERTESYFPNMQWTYNALPSSAKGLADVGFDALGLSNNHVLDRGPEGLDDTLEHIRAAGIQPFGAGRDGDEAAAPLLIRTPYGVIGVLGFGEAWRQGAVAGPGRAGTVPFTDEKIARGAEAARAAGARWIIGFVQWGVNYGGVVPRQQERAAAFARAGYDLVIGHHPHVVQEVGVIDGMPVLYSIGNFAFGTEGRFTKKAPGYGLVVRTAFGADGLHAIQLHCILTDNDVVKFQPRPCDEASAQSLIRSLGPHTSWSDGAGLVAH